MPAPWGSCSCRRTRPRASRSTPAAVASASPTSTNPDINIRYGAWYLGHLLDRYHGDERLALAAYNAGQENVDRWQREHAASSSTRRAHYVVEVERLKKIYRRTYASQLGY